MWRIEQFELRGEYRIWVRFADGLSGEVDLLPDLWGETGEPLLDRAVFAQAGLDECGGLAWPTGFDVAPEALREELRAKCAPAGVADAVVVVRAGDLQRVLRDTRRACTAGWDEAPLRLVVVQDDETPVASLTAPN